MRKDICKISIAMATYNGSLYLQEQLNSFIEQTRQPDELLVSDDASDDNTLEILYKFAEKAPFDVIIKENDKNIGYGANFNRALELATGDIIFLSDQDDVWFKNKIEIMVREASSTCTMLLMNDAALTDKNLSKTGVTKLEQIRSAGLPDTSFVMGCCIAVRKEFLNLILPIPKEFPAHDNWIVNIAEGIKQKIIIKKVLQYYRRHGANESNYIVNQTKKIKKREIIKRRFFIRLKKIVDTRLREEKENNALQYKKVLQYGVERALLKSKSNLREELLCYRAILINEIECIKRRQIIRGKNGVTRIYHAVKFWLNGNYKHFSGFMSLFKDIIFQ